MESTAMIRVRSASPAKAIALKVLLVCGGLATLVYIGSDIIASMRYPGYSYAGQAFSELLAIGSPVRPFMLQMANVYNLLVIAFSIGVLIAAKENRALRWTGIMLLLFGITSATGPYFPMHQRGSGATSFTDIMHIIVTVLQLVGMAGFIAFGSASRGKAFRWYSIMTVVVMAAFGVLAFTRVTQMAAGTPTPFLGLIERASIYAMLVWTAVLSGLLVRDKAGEA